MIQRDIPLSEVMRRLHEMNQQQEQRDARQASDGLAAISLVLAFGVACIWLAIYETRNEVAADRAPIEMVQR